MKQIIRTGMLVCVFMSGLYLFKFSKSEEKVLYPASCHCVVDPILSEKMNQTIIDFVQQKYDQKQEMQDFLHAVQERFPVIASASVSLDNAETMKLFLVSQKPYIRVNTNLISTQSGAVFSLDTFSENSILDLKKFTCSQKYISDRLQKRAILFFEKILPTFFNEYTIHWVSNEEVWLKKQEEQHEILVSSSWDMNMKDLYACHKIQDGLVEKQNEENKKKRKKVIAKWVCDLRCKGQVIAYPIFS